MYTSGTLIFIGLCFRKMTACRLRLCGWAGPVCKGFMNSYVPLGLMIDHCSNWAEQGIDCWHGNWAPRHLTVADAKHRSWKEKIMKEAFHQLLKIYDRKFLNLIAFFFHPPSLIILSQVSFSCINLFLLENHLVNCYEHQVGKFTRNIY